LQQARVRAIEQGLPLVRAANTGVSAIIDPLGRSIGSRSLGSEGVLDGSLPRPIDTTAYLQIGDGPVIAMVLLAIAIITRRRARHK
jgi:apolipoprotein N-acyltransferase